MERRHFFRPGVEQLEDRTVPSTIPLGFSETTFGSGLTLPTAMEFAPDGRLFVTEKGGNVRVFQSDGTLNPTPFLTLSVDTVSERGLNGITLDPNFSTNRFVYVYYTTSGGTPVNRLSRFTADSSNPDVVQSNSELILLDNIAATNGNHNGGSLHFGTDGKLYIGVGEAGVPANSRTLANLSGKILRINSDGSIPADNPFVGVNGARGEIWALGFRNPFTFGVDSGSGRIYVNDVGGRRFEEIDDLMRGADYGWMLAEGPSNIAGLTNPIYSYAHDGNGDSITGGTFYRASQFPTVYDGSYFFADFLNRFIRRLDVSNNPREFITDASSPVDLDVGSDGSLYYLSLFEGKVFKVSHVGLNVPLTAAGTGPGGGAMVTLFDATTHAPLKTYNAFTGYNGNVQVAMGELTGDDIPDVVVGAGNNAHVKVLDGATGEAVRSFLAFPGFPGAANVATGDIDDDGTIDIIVGAGPGAGPHVKVFSGRDNSLLHSFFAYGSAFGGGVSVASADFNNDGVDDIVTGAGAGAGPHVRVFSGVDLSSLASFFAYAPSFTGGIRVAAGDLDGDGQAEIVTAPAAGAGPHVKVFNGGDAVERASFFAYVSSFTGGVRLGVVDVDGNGRKEIVTVTGVGPRPHVKVFRFSPLLEIDSFLAFAAGFAGGAFVAGEP